MKQHEGNNDIILPAFILENDNENFMEVFVTNTKHIQADNQEGKLKNVYYFLTYNLHTGYREI